ncbi:Myb-like DNA-binding domain containing protein [Tritrichomonas foetus]|uniref:Myb-like DNA-binding domain containing protein n=1 Tax=Tritrichomonas foetus TaxID=1144522 RepID=A0A1J4K951_9EUKA|nr:Myb-like DNA-binding domain containing protein [Tritrichomonas foetus]|eukprot:OHT07466.1 Myb-like DNA-binding domain containing protein [Tritrichomonas foetus]
MTSMRELTVIPVADYIMSLFPEPIRYQSNINYPTVHRLLESFIENDISLDECKREVLHYTTLLDPVDQLNVIKGIANDNSHVYKYPDSTRRKKFQNWTQTENNRLLAGILKYGLNNWTAISKFVGSKRTRSQCNQRWTRSINPNLIKEAWTIEETEKLIDLINKHGEKSWTLISSLMGNRSDVQCMYHYYQVAKKKYSSALLHKNINNIDTNNLIDSTISKFMTPNNLEMNSIEYNNSGVKNENETIIPLVNKESTHSSSLNGEINKNNLTDKSFSSEEKLTSSPDIQENSSQKSSSSDIPDDLLDNGLFPLKLACLEDLIDQPEWFFDRSDL